MTHPAFASSRRTLLRGTGVAALALGGALSGCSGSQRQPSAPATSPAASGTAAAVQLPAAEVPVGGGVVLEDSDYVVTQPRPGEFRAFSKVCTHQGCPVGEVAEGQIVCFCHGSAFSIEDGSVLQGPAEEPLAGAAVTSSGDQLSVG
ncbi:Rieske 2Fe-2S domain-containing protein [Auraticoccus sp. F435]|uniref:Cytochrome bc1 complex Rieske iron-sulfur subunit n=1 Tax=Auraticoccus cholistanensis TaxID=2656650 RepID=A0A6A9UX16_9ACTN|nr:Rieske (2Fe-2S) protein [Auraticoccus cholistanensis]MVA77251.1 Rieske 2Fe-2S domain-containing protein [Auraticoccus cholistanensis]